MRRFILHAIALLLVGAFVTLSGYHPPRAFAQGNCSNPGQCIGGRVCVCQGGGSVCNLVSTSPPCAVNNPTSITGRVIPPKGINDYNNAVGGDIGAIAFASNVVFLLNVGAGLFAMYNFLLAGLTYISAAGTADTHNKVKDKLTYTFVGLALIVATFTIGGLIGLIFYGDAGFLLNPQLDGAL